MRRDDVNEIGLAILLVAAVLLAADCVWLHVKCARQEARLAAFTECVTAQANAVVELSERLDRHINPPAPPSEPTFVDKAKQTYEKVKSAAAKGIEAAKEAYLEQPMTSK